MKETFFQKWFDEVSDNFGAFKGVRGSTRKLASGTLNHFFQLL